MGLVQEFKKFALKGNVVDMAVGIIIGGAFGKIVNSLVGDIIMPLVGAISGGKSFAGRFVWFGSPEARPESVELAKESGQAFLAWGNFLQVTLDFVIVAFALFLLIKLMNEVRERFEHNEAPAAAPVVPEDVLLLREIRDELKSRST